MHDELITIQVFSFPPDLYMAKSFLESEDIECFVKDETMGQILPLFASSALGGIKLQVREEDAEKAIQLLIEGGFATAEDYE